MHGPSAVHPGLARYDPLPRKRPAAGHGGPPGPGKTCYDMRGPWTAGWDNTVRVGWAEGGTPGRAPHRDDIGTGKGDDRWRGTGRLRLRTSGRVRESVPRPFSL